jgi:X-X-X-Leu-X-X-Gly heptad repeat protein
MRFACRMTVLAAVLTGLLVPAAAGAGPLAAASASPAPAGGTELWLARYTPPGGGGANAIAASPDGARVYVTGKTTAGFAAATGKLLWASAAGPAQTVATQVVVSADGARVFVTGTQTLASGASQYATVAYDAATGARLWQANYGPATADSKANAIGVSPDGSTVFVTGESELVSGNSESYRYATVAYDAATGARRWTARCCRGGVAQAVSLAVSPDGAQVYVTGASITPAGLKPTQPSPTARPPAPWCGTAATSRAARRSPAARSPGRSS